MEYKGGAPFVDVNIASESEQIILNDNLELWMTKLPPYLKTLPIIHLAIPGSHNTMTYTIHRYNDVGPDIASYLRILGKYFACISKPIIFNWSVTQYDTILEQLNGGIRYLDLRLATKSGKDDFFFLHGLYGDEVTQYFLEISTWLSYHPNEIIIMDCQHFYQFSDDHHKELVRKIKTIFGSKICPASFDLSKISIDWMNQRRFQAIIIYRNEIARREKDLWPSGLWPTPWPNTVHPENLIDFLDTRLKTRVPRAGFISQCLLTPNTSYVIKHLCGSLHRDLAGICRTAARPWIEEHCPGNGGLNIIITDYVSYQDFLFSKIVVQRNASLIDNDHMYLENK